MPEKSPPEMTPKAALAFEVYRDMGPTRSLRKLAQYLGLSYKSNSQLRRWSSRYGWQALCAEHDHKDLRDALGKREITREQCLQHKFIDRMNDAADTLYEIMMDKRKIPILDRQGEPVKDEQGRKLYKPMVRASTRAMCAEKLLGIAGLVPVKRTETVDRTGEALDEAAQAIATMSPAQLEEFMDILKKEKEDDAS